MRHLWLGQSSLDSVTRAVEARPACERHRGSDASGYFSGGRGVIARTARRSSTSSPGDPPITNEDATIGAVLNGDVFNFRRLRQEQRDTGHQVSTDGDTEVLSHLADEGGAADLARRLDGMLAVAEWDRQRDRLTLGRDRMGKKPLYYGRSPQTFVFASEIKSVLAHPSVCRELDERAISAYLTFG